MSNVLVRDLVQLPAYLREQLAGSRAIRAIHGTVTFADAAVAVNIGTIPVDSVVLGAFVNVKTAFNSTGTDLLDVGTTLDPDGFVVDADLAATGVTFKTGGALIGTIATAELVQLLYSQSIADATAGEAAVTVLYLEAA